MRISDWSSDVCSSDLPPPPPPEKPPPPPPEELPGGVDDEAICEVRLLPIALPSEPRSVVPAPWYQVMPLAATATAAPPTARVRSEERRVGKECGRTCRSRW